jgi:hypothetical protein
MNLTDDMILEQLYDRIIDAKKYDFNYIMYSIEEGHDIDYIVNTLKIKFPWVKCVVTQEPYTLMVLQWKIL